MWQCNAKPHLWANPHPQGWPGVAPPQWVLHNDDNNTGHDSITPSFVALALKSDTELTSQEGQSKMNPTSILWLQWIGAGIIVHSVSFYYEVKIPSLLVLCLRCSGEQYYLTYSCPQEPMSSPDPNKRYFKQSLSSLIVIPRTEITSAQNSCNGKHAPYSWTNSSFWHDH